MSPEGRAHPVDPVAGAAVVLALAGLVGYLWVIADQEGDPAVWFVVALAVGAVAAAYGAATALPHRRVALAVGAVLLVSMGLLGILTIGLPILVAGVVCVAALVRAPG